MSGLRRYASLGVIAVTLALAYGIWYAYSVLLVALLGEFGWSRSVLAGAFSVFTLVHGGANPFIGSLCGRFGPLPVTAVGGVALGLALFADSFIATPTQLYLGFGVATALAVAAAGWTPALVYVQREFQERVGLAMGIASSGVGIGILLVVPLTQVLIEAFGWRTAFQVLGLVSVLWIVPASLWLMRQRNRGQTPIQNWGQTPLRQDQEKSGSDPNRAGRAGMTLREAMRTHPFWLLVAAFFFGNVCSQMMHVHHVAYLVDNGLSAMVAASVVSLVGFSSILAKTGGGWLSDRIEREYVYLACVSVMAVSVLVLLSMSGRVTSAGAYGYAVLFGLGYSVTASLTPAMVSDRFSGPHFGSIVGIGLMSAAFGSAVGPWLGGRLFDATGSYLVPFLISVACALVAMGCGLRLKWLRKSGTGSD